MPISIVPMTKEEIKKNQKRFPKNKKPKKAQRAAPMAKTLSKPLKRKGGGMTKKTKYMSKGGKLTGMARRRNARRG